MPRRKRNILVSNHQLFPAVTSVAEQEHDILLDRLVKTIGSFGFRQILPPPVEERRLYARTPQLQRHFGSKAVGVAGSDPADLVLSPTYFPSVLCRYENDLHISGQRVLKWFYVCPILESQGGRLVTHHELGMFIFGEDTSLANAQLINTVAQVLDGLGIKQYLTEINNLGCTTCQKDYQTILREHLQKSKYEFCSDCSNELEENPLRVWGCEQPGCQLALAGAPQIVDFLDQPCRDTLVGVLETLDVLGIPYALNPALNSTMVREKILFRLTAPDIPEQLGLGGSYGFWVRSLGLEGNFPVLGFLSSLETLGRLIPEAQRQPGSDIDVFVLSLGEIGARRALLLHRQLQRAGILVGEAMLGSSGIKSQLKEAQERHSEIALIVGQKEALDETVILRDMRSGMQEVFAIDRIVEEVWKRLGK